MEWYKHMDKPFEVMTEEQKEILRKGLEESEMKELKEEGEKNA